jgi:hypothetical protein
VPEFLVVVLYLTIVVVITIGLSQFVRARIRAQNRLPAFVLCAIAAPLALAIWGTLQLIGPAEPGVIDKRIPFLGLLIAVEAITLLFTFVTAAVVFLRPRAKKS